jgi:hypothetical protein
MLPPNTTPASDWYELHVVLRLRSYLFATILPGLPRQEIVETKVRRIGKPSKANRIFNDASGSP